MTGLGVEFSKKTMMVYYPDKEEVKIQHDGILMDTIPVKDFTRMMRSLLWNVGHYTKDDEIKNVCEVKDESFDVLLKKVM